MNKKVSIIIPVYNAALYLKRCIDSICNQTYGDWHIIAIDDGSTDDSWNILEEYKRCLKDKITIIHQENSGVAKTRNRGIEESKGDYILFIDNDDYIDTEYIECYVHAIEEGGYDCVIGGFRREDKKNKVIKSFVPDSLWSVYTADLVPWARIFKTQFIVENHIEFLDNSIGEDIYFNFEVFSKTNNIAIIKNIGYVWYYNEKSVSNSSQRGLKNIKSFISLLEKIWAVSAKEKMVKVWLLRYAVWYLLYFGKYAEKQRFIKADRVLFEWLNEHNISWRYVKSICLSKDGMLIMRLVVPAYLLIRKLRMLNLFVLIYCNRKS